MSEYDGGMGTTDSTAGASPADENVLEIHWVAHSAKTPPVLAADADEARALLDDGSAAFASLGNDSTRYELRVDPSALGFVAEDDDDGILDQEPFAAILSCSDARVPIELTLGRATNDLFVVRVAGNVPGSDCLGSLHYASDHLPSVRLFGVVGHSGCGAITAAVDAVLVPRDYLPIARLAPLRGIVDSLFGGIRIAAIALDRAHGADARGLPGYRAALIELSTLANTALTASIIGRDLGRPAAYGVYDLTRRRVGVVTDGEWAAGFVPAPETDDALRLLIDSAARGLLRPAHA